MKKTLQNTFKVGAVIALMLSAGAVSAQTTVGGDVAKGSNTVRLIDNKGTIKYLQSNNGITTITNTTNDVTTTTWQLGGTLTAATDINTADQNFSITVGTAPAAGGTDGQFILNGIKAKDGLAATEIKTDGSAGTGYTLLVRDEATGAVKKMLATDLITSGQTYFTATSGQTLFTVTAGGVGNIAAQAIPLPNFSKVWVYRNGAKLIANVDYTVGVDAVTLVPNGTAPNDWAIYAGDVVEIQYIK